MKYIIEIPSKADFVTAYYMENGLPVMYTSDKIDDLEPYIESDRKAIENEVWSFVDFLENKLKASDYDDVFDDNSPYDKYTYQEAKAKYEAWLKQKDEIKIGDEVIAKDNMKNAVGDYYESFIITGMLYNNVIGFGKKYKNHSMGINDVVKTGRHFTRKEIDILKEYLEIDENNQCEQKISCCCEKA